MEKNRFFPEINGNFGFGCMRLPMIGDEVDHKQFCDMADAFAKPLSPVAAGMHRGPLKTEHSAAELLEGSVQICAMKRAEDSGDLVVRLWETRGKNTVARLRIEGADSWRFCNTLEEDAGDPVPAVNGVIEAPVPTFATRSIKVCRK